MLSYRAAIKKLCFEAGLSYSENIFDLEHVPATIRHKHFYIMKPNRVPAEDISSDQTICTDKLIVRSIWLLNTTNDIELCEEFMDILTQNLIDISECDYGIMWKGTESEYTDNNKYYITDIELSVERRLVD